MGDVDVKGAVAFSVEQGEDGYRYSIEPFLLADFIKLSPGDRVLDVGTGCGIIPLLLLKREPCLQITAVEIQPSLYESAVRNVSQNGLTDRVEVVPGDFSRKGLLQGQFDMIVSNPPYRKINSGRINPNRIKALARHELALTLSSLLENASALLKPGGKITLAYPPARLEEVRRELVRVEIRPDRLRFVHGHQRTNAKIALIEAVKGGSAECVVDEPFCVYNDDGSYSREMQEIYVSFNHTGRSHRQRKK
jgi:tRNA1Val (adenine37-N6)-methyltransferase